MNKVVEFIVDFKLRIFTEMSMAWGGIGGIFTTVFINGTIPEEPSLGHKAYETIVLAGLGGVVGAIGGLLVAIIWAVYIKPWIKRKFGVDINYKN